MTDLEQRVAGIKADYETCFGCGTRNPIGLQVGGFASARAPSRRSSRHEPTITVSGCSSLPMS